MIIKRLAHANIGTYDLAKSEHFYCTVLGLEKAFDFRRHDELFGFYVKTGEMTFIEVFLQDQADCQRPIIHHLCLEVEDIDEAITHIRNHGWEISDKSFGSDRAWQAWITDPSGVSIEIMQYTPESSQFTGNDCIAEW